MNNLDLLSAWAKYSGINRENAEQNGRIYTFMFGDHFSVSIEAPAYSDDIFIIIELIEAGTGYIKHKRFETAMSLNAYALETRGGVIGWDSVNQCIILTYRFNTHNTTTEMLDNMIANLIEVAENIKPLLALECKKEKTEIFNRQYDALFQPVISQEDTQAP